MVPYSIEVVPEGNGWRWQIISPAGRILYQSQGPIVDCSLAAFNAAKRWRGRHMEMAREVDDYSDLARLL